MPSTDLGGALKGWDKQPSKILSQRIVQSFAQATAQRALQGYLQLAATCREIKGHENTLVQVKAAQELLTKTDQQGP
jgi:hypothetical protein